MAVALVEVVSITLIINETSSNAICAEGKDLNDSACLPQVVGEWPSNRRPGKSSGQTLPHMVRATRPEANGRARMANVSAHCVLRSVLSCGSTVSRHCLRSVFLREVALVALVVGFIISGIRFNIGGNGDICSRHLVLHREPRYPTGATPWHLTSARGPTAKPTTTASSFSLTTSRARSHVAR